MNFNYQKGFSLIEILISVFILSIASIGAFKLYSHLEKEKYKAHISLSAHQVAQQQIAKIQTINTVDGDCGDIDTISDSCLLEVDEIKPFSINFSAINEMKHTLVTGTPEVTYAKTITIKVSWKDRDGQPKEINLPVTVSNSTNKLN